MTGMTINEVVDWTENKKFMGKPMSYGYAMAILDRQFPIIKPEMNTIAPSRLQNHDVCADNAQTEQIYDRMTWTEELDAKLWDLYIGGMTNSDIAKELYCSKAAVTTRICIKGFAKKKRRLKKKNR